MIFFVYKNHFKKKKGFKIEYIEKFKCFVFLKNRWKKFLNTTPNIF